MSQFFASGRKIVAIGRNYAAHAKELNNAIPTEPFMFLKPTSSYVRDREPVELPKGVILHHEVELGVVIGSKAKNVTTGNALSHIAGYALAIDYTARNVQDEVKKKGLPWTTAKGLDTFCPVSDFIPAGTIRDPHDLNLWYKVNGAYRQNGPTSLMLYKIPELIRHVSGIMTLEEGDLLLTGTPSGVSAVVPGDKITAGLQQDGKDIMTLEHEIIQRIGGFVYEPKN